MTVADDALGVLRRSHRQLAEIADRLDPAGLAAGSYCRDWTIAQVFSHLGSGAEIGLGSLRAVLDDVPRPDHESIWARWNALPAEEMARQFVAYDDQYLAMFEQLDDEVRDALRMPFFLGPLDLPALLRFRLSEHALHAWDIRVSLDPRATLSAGVPELVLPVTQTLLAMVRPPADRPAPVRLAVHTSEPERHYLLAVDDAVALHDVDAEAPAGEPPTGRLELPAEAFIRLAAGRLDPDHTPPGVSIEGATTLADLRALFPGY